MIFPQLAQELTEALEYVELPERRFCLFGSAVMYLHGLREMIGDIDVWVTHSLYRTLLNRGWKEHSPQFFDPPFAEKRFDGVKVNAFYDWKKRGMQIPIHERLSDPEIVNGWPCQPLQELCIWKAGIAHRSDRPKDWTDVAAIAQYLSEKQEAA